MLNSDEPVGKVVEDDVVNDDDDAPNMDDFCWKGDGCDCGAGGTADATEDEAEED